MKLLTEEIIRALPPLYSTENVPLEEKLVIYKLLIPDANWTWFLFEGEKQIDSETGVSDYLFFGMVHSFEQEMGYFSLSELLNVRGPLGLLIERDRSIFKVRYGELITKNA